MAAANNKQQFHVLYCNKSWADDRMMVGPAIFWRKADLKLYRNFLQHHQNSTSGSGGSSSSSHASVVHPNLAERRNTKTGFGFECQSFDSVEQALSFLEEENIGKNNTTNDQEKKNKQKTKLTAKTTATMTTKTTTLTKKKSPPPPVANTPAAVGGRLVCNSAARNGRKAASSTTPALITTTANTVVPPSLSVIGTTTPSAAAATTVTPPACLVPRTTAAAPPPPSAAAAPTTAVVPAKQPVPAPPPPPFLSPPLLPQPAPPFLLPFVTVAAASVPITATDAAKTTNGGMYAPIAPNGVLPPATVLPLTEPTISKRRRRPKRSAEEREADKKRASEARKRQRTDKFTEKYQAHMDLLRKFKSERGHANVPQKIPRGSPDDVKGYRRLHFWLKSIKVQIERYEDDPDTSMLSDAQAKELQEMGVERTRSKAEKRFRQDEATFDDMFREFQNYHAQHGHTNVPQQPRTALYSWVMRIRQAYQELKQKPTKKKSTSDPSPTRNVLTPQRMAQLAQLGFSFTTATRASFDERALEWLEYKTKHQCEPPPKTILGGWCKRTRRRYRDLVHGRKNKRWEPLTQEQADKLTDWGFNWGNVSKSTDPSKKTKNVSMSFAQRLEMLQSYKQEHGNVLIPASHPDLGKWCKRLRLEYRKLQNGQKLSKATLNQARIEQLLGLGFDFGFQPNDSRRSINAGRGSEGSRDGSDSDSSSSTSDDEDEDEGEDADDDDDDDDDVDEDDDNNNGEHRYPPHQLQGSSPGEQQRLVFPHTLRDRQQQQQQQPWDKYNTDPSPNLHH